MSESPRPPEFSRRAWRFEIGLIAAVGLGWAAVLATPLLANALGLGSTGPFFDLQGILAANEAAGRGLDPFGLNPLDAYHRPFLYSTWWLWPALGVTRTATVPLGVGLVALTLVAALGTWRVRSGREALVAGVVLLSPAWLLAVFRANNDLVIFGLLIFAGWALRRVQRGWRVGAAALTGAMTILKYYPAAIFIGLLRAPRRREVLVLLAVAAGVVALGWPSLGPAIGAIARYGFQVTASVGLLSFGVKALGAAMAPHVGPGVAGLVGLIALFSGFQLAKGTLAADTSPEGEDRLMAAALGGAMLLGSWLIGTSFIYKLVFLWPLLPWLLRDAPTALDRGRAVQLLAIVIFACWADALAATFINTFGPGWSRDARLLALNFSHGFSVVTQLAYWVIMGACLRLVLDWSRRQLARLAGASPVK